MLDENAPSFKETAQAQKVAILKLFILSLFEFCYLNLPEKIVIPAKAGIY